MKTDDISQPWHAAARDLPDYRVCTRCVMDTTDPDIRFDDEGVCSHCTHWTPVLEDLHTRAGQDEECLTPLADEIRRAGRGKEYDCVVGISGGVDSSYVAYLAKRLSLRPMVIHFDNGWDAEVAVGNIKKLIESLDFDLNTYVINWEEFRDLQRSFIKASVLDIEMVTDHAHAAATLKIARQYGIRYILRGNNSATENGLPRAWSWFKRDLTNIRAIHRRFGEVPLKSYPTLSTWNWWFRLASRQIRFARPLDLIAYRKDRALEMLSNQCDWQYYGGKHYESLFTKFYQAYILPRKFGIDKRKAHLSALIRNSEIARDEAMAILESPPYPPEELRQDKAYVLKKLRFTQDEFEALMRKPARPHTAYPSVWRKHGPLWCIAHLRRLVTGKYSGPSEKWNGLVRQANGNNAS